MSKYKADPRVLQRLEKKWLSQAHAHLIQDLRGIEKKYSSFCVLEDRGLSRIYHYLEHSGEGLKRNMAHSMCSRTTVISLKLPSGFLGRIEEDGDSLRVFIEEYLQMLSHLLQTLRRTEEECHSFCEFLAELQSTKSRLLQSLQHIEQNSNVGGFSPLIQASARSMWVFCSSKVSTVAMEMLNILRSNIINLPVHALVFDLQHIKSVIVDAGLLVYSLTVEGETDQALSNLPGIDGLVFMDLILDNLMELLSHYSNSIDSVNSQLETIQKELKCFQAIVEQQDGLQHFVTQTNGLVYEVEYIFDSCKKKDVPDWCLFPWILNVGEDIRVLMAEVAELQETNVFDLMLHNTTNASNADTSSHLLGILAWNEENGGS
ncbi:hypothetical protein HAX54_033306 [Datura stramonium]|uniref:Late blight resistance protein R1A-like N-terminal domain-containing protein n=1 Tax=Datura stramonium TaxID=4076 RepID=A0ABS8SDB5_DATST|nr:hypothetical protein [Datura stramonium]